MFAQPNPGQWVGDLYLVRSDATPHRYLLIDEKNHVLEKIPPIVFADGSPVSGDSLIYGSSYWHNDALFTLASGDIRDFETNSDGSRYRRWTFAKWQDNEWHFLAEYKAEYGNNLKAIPCDGDRFIIISATADLVDNDRQDRTPFAVMTLNSQKNEMKLGASIDHGQDELREQMRPKKNAFPLIVNMSNVDTDAFYRQLKSMFHSALTDHFRMASESSVALTDEYATLVNKRFGLFWIFSREKASIKKAGNIFTKVTKEMIANGGFRDVVLRVNPEKDGTILISALDEAIFTVGEKELLDVEVSLNNFFDRNLSPEDRAKILLQANQENIQRNPYIVWYRIYPWDGKVEKLSAGPPGGSLGRDGGENDDWRPMPDGSIKFGNILSSLVQKTKSDQDESSAEANKK
jgi:hypothetical protein